MSARSVWRSLSGAQRSAWTDRIYVRDGGVCSLCGKPVARAEASVDHVVPESKGGPTTEANMRLAHRRCNSSKQDRVPSGAALARHDGLDWFT